MARPELRVRGGGGALRGVFHAARDKSITHRAVLLGALAEGVTVIETPLLGAADIECTRAVVERLGATTDVAGGRLVVRGPVRPEAAPWTLDAGASGTTARLVLGVLAGLGAPARLDGAPGLRRRPMDRVTAPLRAMGARFAGDARRLPVELLAGGPLEGREHVLEVASAQVASACLLAGLFARGTTSVTVPGPCRDHTERMLAAFGVAVDRRGPTSAVTGPAALRPARVHVPVDASSALYPAVLALLRPGSDLVLADVGVNPTRTGALEVLWRMGADVRVGERRSAGSEPVADVRVRASPLRGTDVEAELFPRLLDDVPVLAAAAAAAVDGATTFRGVRELRLKESDRIASVARMLRAFGARVEEGEDVLTVHPAGRLVPAAVDAMEDHRVAMSAIVLGASAPGETVVRGADVVAQSYPGFASAMRELGVDVEETTA